MATNTEIIKDAYASFAKGDIPAALSAFADDILWVEPDCYPIGGTYVGPQAVVEGVFLRLAEIGDEFAVVPEQFVADGDIVVALGHLSWKHKSTGAPALVKRPTCGPSSAARRPRSFSTSTPSGCAS
jgi:uncharacterized protein